MPPALILAVTVVVSVAQPAPPVNAQIPEEFTNLKVLDQDIGQRELVGIMRNWAGGLGVRCNHCHVGPDDLQGMDFASDEKEHKRAARVMLEMTRAINRQYVGSWEDHDDGASDSDSDSEAGSQTVSCFTCHRGQPEPPRKLSWILGDTVLSDGVDAAMAQYRELRAEHYGAGLYDFSEKTFGQLAQMAFENGKPDAGMEILRAALEVYPDSADLRAFLGFGLMQGGDVDGAAAKFDEALEIDPENANARRGKMTLERMRPRPEGDG